MYNDDAMSKQAKIFARKVKRRIRRQPYQEVTEITPLLVITSNRRKASELSEPLVKLDDSVNDDCATNPWKIPASTNSFIFLLRWPITFTLWCTIPDPRCSQRFYVMTFINCALWIGCISYFVVFVTTDVGELL